MHTYTSIYIHTYTDRKLSVFSRACPPDIFKNTFNQKQKQDATHAIFGPVLSHSLSLFISLSALVVSAAPKRLINFAISSLLLIYMTWRGQ